MTNNIPPCPDRLLAKLSRPVLKNCSLARSPHPGTAWEVEALSGELLLMLLLRGPSGGGRVPPVVRGIPLTDFVRIDDPDSEIVSLLPSNDIFSVHLWCEGPILQRRLVRCVGECDAKRLQQAESYEWLLRRQLSDAVSQFRVSLYEQVDPVFRESWSELYASLENDAPSPEDLVWSEKQVNISSRQMRLLASQEPSS